MAKVTYSQIEKELKEVPSLERLIRSNLRQLKRKEEELGLVGDVRAMSFDGIKVSPTNDTSDPTADAIVLIDEMRSEIVEDIRALKQRRKVIKDKIKVLDPLEQSIINYRYFEELAWHKVAELCNYEASTCRKKLHLAINKIVEEENKKEG